MICSTTTPSDSRSSSSAGVADTNTARGVSDEELVEHQRPVVERARQTEAVVDERQLARAVAVEHPADLRQRDVRLVDDDEEVFREIVEQTRRPLARFAPGEMARVVLDAGARPDLEHHLDVEVRARLEPLRLEQLAGVAQLGQPLGELGADQLHRALERRALGDEVLRRIDRRALERRDRLAGEHVDLRDALDLVAPHLDAHALLFVRREDLDRVAAHAERAALERDVVAGVLDPHERAQNVVAVDALALA